MDDRERLLRLLKEEYAKVVESEGEADRLYAKTLFKAIKDMEYVGRLLEER